MAASRESPRLSSRGASAKRWPRRRAPPPAIRAADAIPRAVKNLFHLRRRIPQSRAIPQTFVRLNKSGYNRDSRALFPFLRACPADGWVRHDATRHTYHLPERGRPAARHDPRIERHRHSRRSALLHAVPLRGPQQHQAHRRAGAGRNGDGGGDDLGSSDVPAAAQPAAAVRDPRQRRLGPPAGLQVVSRRLPAVDPRARPAKFRSSAKSSGTPTARKSR